MLWPKKNSCKEFDNEKKFLRLENSPPPHNFSNGPSLTKDKKFKHLGGVYNQNNNHGNRRYGDYGRIQRVFLN